MSEVQDLATLIRAGTPLVTIETAEEERAIEAFRHVVGQVWRPLYRWSITDGLQRLDLDAEAPDGQSIAPDATQTLLAIKQEPQRGVYLLCDFHPYLRYAMTQRLVREIVQRQGSQAHTLVLIAPRIELPPELAGDAVRFSLALPGEQQIAKLVRDEAFVYSREHGGKRVEVDPAALKLIVRNRRGLSLGDARRIARQVGTAILSGGLPTTPLEVAAFHLSMRERPADRLHFLREKTKSRVRRAIRPTS